MAARIKTIVLLLGWCASAVAAERMTAFHSDIRIAANGGLTVTETIEVQTSGRETRRGIVRDFPGDYHDRFGGRVNVPLIVDRVMRNRAAEPFTLERVNGGFRLRTGDAHRPLPPGKHVYAVTYRTARQIGFLQRHDELYWNVSGSGWPVALERLTAEVSFEQPVPADDIKVDAWTGAPGARGQDFNAFVRSGSAAFRATRPLAPREAMIVLVEFPKGVVSAPSPFERGAWVMATHRGASVGAGIFGLMLALILACRRRFGPDEALGGYGLIAAGIGIAGVLAMLALDTAPSAVAGVCGAVVAALLGLSGIKPRVAGIKPRLEASGRARARPRRPWRRTRSAAG